MCLAPWDRVPGISSQRNQCLISSLCSAIRVKTKTELQALETRVLPVNCSEIPPALSHPDAFRWSVSWNPCLS